MALVLSALTASPGSAQGDSVESSAHNIEIKGYLLDSSGAPLIGGSLTVYEVVNNPNGSSTSTPLATATTGNKGAFHVKVQPATLAQDTTGNIPLQLGYNSTSGPGMMYDVRLVHPAADSVAWKLEMPPTTVEMATDNTGSFDPVFQVGKGAVDASAGLSNAVGQSLAGSELSTADGSITANSVSAFTQDTASMIPQQTSVSTMSSAATVTPADSTDTGVAAPDEGTDTSLGRVSTTAVTSCSQVLPAAPTRINWYETGAVDYRYIPSKLIITKNAATMGWDVTRTNETTLSVMENVGGNKYAGGFSASTSQSSSISWQPRVSAHNQNKLFKVEWKYVQQRAHCDYVAVSSPPSQQPAIDMWRWVPAQSMSGNRLDDTNRGIVCGGSGPAYNSWYGSRTSIGTQSSVVYSGEFSISGIGLSAQQVDSTSETFWVQPNNGGQTRLCGNDGDPGVADLVREVPTS